MDIYTHSGDGKHYDMSASDDFPVSALGEGRRVALTMADKRHIEGRCYRAFGGWLGLLGNPVTILADDVVRLDIYPAA